SLLFPSGTPDTSSSTTSPVIVNFAHLHEPHHAVNASAIPLIHDPVTSGAVCGLLDRELNQFVWSHPPDQSVEPLDDMTLVTTTTAGWDQGAGKGASASASAEAFNSSQTPELLRGSLTRSPSPPTPPSNPTPARRHKCHLCEWSFTKSNDLKRHERSVHRDEAEPVYRCRCGYESTRKDNYLRHVDTCRRVACYSSYACKCRIFSEDKTQHVHHVVGCQFAFGLAGRPPHSSLGRRMDQTPVRAVCNVTA
ncbi:hypothetical protein F4774DRAFT_424166, partial [Daldinia eschscholtzii]